MSSEFQEISSHKLLDISKELYSHNEYSLAMLYLLLIKYSSNSDYRGVKIQSLYNLSLIYLKQKDEKGLNQIGYKIFKWLKKIDLKRYNEEVIITFLEILLINEKIFFDNDQEILSAWYLYTCKNIIMENSIKNEEANNKIKKNFPVVLQRFNDILINEYIDLKNKKKSFEEINNKLNNKYTFKKGEKVYIVNKKWLNNMIKFNECFNNEKIESKTLFNGNKVCLLYFDEDKTNNDEELKGIYPGPINNYFFGKSNRHWEDPEKKYTNSYIINPLPKDSYVLIPYEQYKIINFYFKNNYEIERYIIDDNENCELYLNEINLLFLNENLRENQKEFLIPKKIQFSSLDNVKEIENKIKRIFINISKEDEKNLEFKIFLLDFNKKEIIEMIIWYINFNKKFKIKGNLLNEFDQNKLFYEIIKDKKIIIVCEVINNSLLVSPFLKKQTSDLYCSLCNFHLEENAQKFPCIQCNQAIYCREECRSSDSQHIEFHKKISNLYDATIKASEIKNININSFLNGESKHGLVGLKSIGNIDFLNSSLQILSHVSMLTKFFLSSNNFLNNKGLAKDSNSLKCVYAELINQLWIGDKNEITPINFRNLFFAMIKDYANQPNIDAFDILIVILDKLHSELNEVKVKNDDLFFYEQMRGESDKQCCNRWWQTHLSMNKSIIIELFQGQFKNIIKCAFCKELSITFPPFLYISLPIPNKEEMTKIHFRVFPYDWEYHYINVELFDINSLTSVRDIKKRISEYKRFKKSKIECLLYKDCELISILNDDELIYDYIFTRYNFSDEEFIEWEISFNEIPENKNNDLITIYVTPCTFEIEKTWFKTNKKINALTYAKPFCLNQKLTLRDLNLELFKYYRRSMDDMIKQKEDGNIDESYYNEFYNNLTNSSYIESEYEKIIDQNFFKLYIYHNLEKSDSWFYNGPKCEFCNVSVNYSNFCEMKLPLNTPLKELLIKQEINRPIFLLADFSKFFENFSNFYTQLEDISDPRMAIPEEINIYDCFDIFKREEKLKKEKDYICPKCSRKIEPFQTIEPYKSPKYLILHIKRFKKRFDDLMDMLNNKKDETVVGFPIENLDLTSYFPGENNECVYDLVSVLCHQGSIKQPHYKTIVKNEDNWYEIDDNIIKKLEMRNQIINNEAYVLVFVRKESKEKEIKEEDDLLKGSSSINEIVGEMKDI